MNYGAWGSTLLITAAVLLLGAFWKRRFRWPLILLSIAVFFIGGVLLFFGIVTTAVAPP